MTDAEVYADAAIMGAVAGIRSMSGPSLVSKLSEAGLLPQEAGTPGSWLANPGINKALKVLAGGEMLVDKLPFLPDRTDAGPLLARAVTGGASGAAICVAAKRPWWIGLLIGAGAAIGATFGATKLRKWAIEEKNIPSAAFGVAEDALVFGCAHVVMSTFKEAEKAIEAAV